MLLPITKCNISSKHGTWSSVKLLKQENKYTLMLSFTPSPPLSPSCVHTHTHVYTNIHSQPINTGHDFLYLLPFGTSNKASKNQTLQLKLFLIAE
uniref:Uncharacterized protein n=1 Tax=Anguilla anguilla TaxID=7936 RepID=A0A0E9WU26_ANGAN